ncbi:uncharacterized protein MONOS_12698 [Monocercomonoides exilis]|uniref:uncharacterized protein n=1 Tax=Monocercomonoides exilis TaxID=2049356 RepID=UPI003559E048|nr:hypothetical protein MONOS_12698 [Monocercomonoides exilis]|eukprot:MONOS_12698.1-p1 / transcript=MONOS_12698.1 / gene=MONOS_12698 / organism=Monocercomonoides_exilis_PA203 / gene_product=unspecified product / transcript_product=unspecified product / location=Mono_scaffold00720:29741-29983(-) / protein_length=81 / sequence_SO=supercontig / SO=protein_coding / is_pseudo=false
MTRKEREAEEKIDKEEEERKKKEEDEKLSREAAIEMEKLQLKRAFSENDEEVNSKYHNCNHSTLIVVDVGSGALKKDDDY